MGPSVVRGLCIVVDGGCAGSIPIQRPSVKVLLGDDCPWMRLFVIGQDIRVLDCNDPHHGVSIATVSDSPPTFHPIGKALITEPNGNGQLCQEFSLL